MKRKTKEKIMKYIGMGWIYFKYQIITKGLVALLIFPLYYLLIGKLMESTGRSALSSGDYLSFLFSYQGLGMLILSLALLSILVGLDINAFIIMSAKNNRTLNTRKMMILGIHSIKNFLKPSGILLLIYVALIIPLVSLGVTISPMQNFQIPNFITSVIFEHSLLKVLYILLLIFLFFITLIYIFTFHFVLITGSSVGDGMKASKRLMKNHWISFIYDFILKTVILSLLFVGVLFGLYALWNVPLILLPDESFVSRFWLIILFITMAQWIGFWTLMAVPITIERLTNLFYKYNRKEGKEISIHQGEIKSASLDVPLESFYKIPKSLPMAILIVFIMNMGSSAYAASHFDDIFYKKNNIEIIAHRGGGDLGPENSIKGLEAAIAVGANWSEFDVQRTFDGHYIINHDPNFSRVASESRSPSEMTLAEIKELRIQDAFDPQGESVEVPTLEEFLDAGKDEIGLFVELKGATADEQMVEDVVKVIKEKDMLDQCVLLSLDYPLIQYIEKKHSEVQTGFLYFFSIGDLSTMDGDFLIMEEREASSEKIKEIHNAGKKAIVWTVNKEESIHRFIRSDIDGIITDHVLKVKDAMEEMEAQKDKERIMDKIFGK
ncbi:MAG: glycerophosphoryl diester phosphodiesterase membrane domain-containing protein [Tissierellia bacterium]|nr:glycerophosphoryl diester phosphodiesterase membrane domain-containing protein [Tissierellia bacterium]